MAERTQTGFARATMVCVDAYEQGVLSGRFYNYGAGQKVHEFHGVMQLLTEMEDLLASADFEEPPNAVRAFPPGTDAGSVNPCKRGKRASFVVKILFRQHTSWQGSVTWLEENAEQPFRSVLELLLLMDSALKSIE